MIALFTGVRFLGSYGWYLTSMFRTPGGADSF